MGLDKLVLFRGITRQMAVLLGSIKSAFSTLWQLRWRTYVIFPNVGSTYVNVVIDKSRHLPLKEKSETHYRL